MERLEIISNELKTAFELTESLDNMVSVFGAARLPQDNPECKLAYQTAKLLGENGLGTISGGGPGIMEAANRGAFEAGATSVGLNIKLPHEQEPNKYQTDPLFFKYFFTRKIFYFHNTNACISYHGGVGTWDELFELLNLQQVEILPKIPIILASTDNYWLSLVELMEKRLVTSKMMDQVLLESLHFSSSAEETLEILTKELNLGK